MDPLTLGKTILDAITTLFGLKEALVKADATRRASAADLFDKIANCLTATATDIRAGQYPAGRCSELLTYATALPSRVQGVVPDGEVQEVTSALIQAHSVEGLYAIRDQTQGHEQLRALDEAAGTLQGLANLLRA